MSPQGETGSPGCTKAEGSGFWTGTGATLAVGQSPRLRRSGGMGKGLGRVRDSGPNASIRARWEVYSMLDQPGPAAGGGEASPHYRLSPGSVQECAKALLV